MYPAEIEMYCGHQVALSVVGPCVRALSMYFQVLVYTLNQEILANTAQNAPPFCPILDVSISQKFIHVLLSTPMATIYMRERSAPEETFAQYYTIHMQNCTLKAWNSNLGERRRGVIVGEPQPLKSAHCDPIHVLLVFLREYAIQWANIIPANTGWNNR